MNSAATDTTRHIYGILENVADPEVPVLSILDLGIVREVLINNAQDQQQVSIVITPTYSGCPAMDMIAMNIRMVMLEQGYKHVQIITKLSPAWTTSWMTEAGKEKLRRYGIAPPNAMHSVCTPEPFQEEEAVQCPQCNAFNTRLISRFGSTACKALYQCNVCKEAFDYFKCH